MTGLRDAMRTSDELRSKVAQQAAVASLGRLALEGADPSMLMRFAMESVPETLCTDFASVLEALPDGRFLARADSGWSPALAGRAIVAPQAAYCLHTAAPVIADEFLADERFRGAEAPEDYGDRSGISVPLHERGEPYGVLNAYSAEVRAFTPDDLHFLQSVAMSLPAPSSDAAPRRPSRSRRCGTRSPASPTGRSSRPAWRPRSLDCRRRARA